MRYDFNSHKTVKFFYIRILTITLNKHTNHAFSKPILL